MVIVMLALKFDLRHDTATKADASLDSSIEAVFIEYRKHSWESKVNKVGMTIRITNTCI